MSQWFPVLHIINATDHNRDCICMKSRLLYCRHHTLLQIKDHYNNNINMTLAACLPGLFFQNLGTGCNDIQGSK